MTEFPTAGGSYIRDPDTGVLIRQPDGPPPASDPVAEGPAPATIEPKRKGGK